MAKKGLDDFIVRKEKKVPLNAQVNEELMEKVNEKRLQQKPKQTIRSIVEAAFRLYLSTPTKKNSSTG